MVYSLLYRRPSFVSSSRASLDGNEKQHSIDESIRSESSHLSSGIPEALSFDRIISGGTCPPCTVRDFMNYLKYIEYSAENLQFYLWYRNYAERFSHLPAGERALAPEWTAPQIDVDLSNNKPMPVKPQVAWMFEGTDFANTKPKLALDPFSTPSATPSFDEKPYAASEYDSTHFGGSQTGRSVAPSRAVDKEFEEAGIKWKPFTAQPYREEVCRVISIYLANGGARELNLSSREKADVLRALQHTTHPSAFKPIAVSIEYTLRRQAHPNFIRWTICNGNRARVIFARGLGVFGIAAGLLADLLLTLSNAGRAWRVVPLVGWFIGIATLIAAWKGMCVVLHGMHHRHVRPWELFEDEEGGEAAALDDERSLSRASLLTASTNSFEDEPWVPKYRRRNVVRKVFDREVWIQEPALRQIQDTIFLQAVLGAFLLSCLCVGIFCAVPHGNFY